MDKSQPSVKGLLNDYVHGVVAWSSHSSYGRKLHTLISYMSVTRKIPTLFVHLGMILCTSQMTTSLALLPGSLPISGQKPD